jgi:type III secretion system YscD/HrpQ family protein
MAQRFIAEQGELKGQVISFDEGTSWVLGRDSTQSQVVINDSSIADRQLLVKRTPEGIILENLSPDHPALINDAPIGSSSILLKSGDTIRIGSELLRFEETTSLDKTEEEFISSALSEMIEEGKLETVDPAAERQPTSEGPEPKQASEPFEDEDLIFDEEMLHEAEAHDSEKIVEEAGHPSEETESPTAGEEHLLEEDKPLAEEDLEHPQDEEEQPFDEDEDFSFDEELHEAESHESEKIVEDAEHPSEEKAVEEEQKAVEEERPHEADKEDHPPEDEDLQHEETVFSDEMGDATLAEIDFGVIETGRWLLKVVGGPNTGAEFYMQSGQSYVLGTDPVNSDIVFQDTSVSRQHAKITVSHEETLTIEDLKSRNGVLINGEVIKEPQQLDPSTIVTLGTTSFAIYDREGEMQTIISPLLPSIVRSLQKEEHPAAAVDATTSGAGEKEGEPAPQPLQEPVLPPQPQRNYSAIILIAVIVGLFALAAIGTTALFQVQQVVTSPDQDAEAMIKQVLSPYSALRYSYNKSTGSLLLIGHVVSIADKNHILYKLQEIKSIKSIDDKGMIIDELAWNEVNTVLSDNPSWRGISLHAPEAGQFVLTGYLKTRKQAEELSNYINRNFPYLDSLKKQVVIEEDVLQSINYILNEKHLTGVNVKINNGEVYLVGEVSSDKADMMQEVIAQVRQVPGVRVVYNQVVSQNPEKIGIINLSDQYSISGKSHIGNKYTVLIHGRLLSEGDVLDGMDITKITSNTVFLERGDKKYRIDY